MLQLLMKFGPNIPLNYNLTNRKLNFLCAYFIHKEIKLILSKKKAQRGKTKPSIIIYNSKIISTL